MKLHALDVELAVAQAHDLALGGPRADLEARRERRALDDERVVARRLEGAGEPREEAAAVVQDGRGLAVHQAPGADDAAAEGLPDGLVPEAHAEDGQLAAERCDSRERDARLVRRARARAR